MHMRMFLAAVAIAALPAIAMAQHDAHPATADGPAAKALKDANDAMMAGMVTLPATGDLDKDFVLMMIPHHEGAIAMAKVVLQYGDDPEIKKLAQAIVASQSSEVAFMTGWLAKQPKQPQ